MTATGFTIFPCDRGQPRSLNRGWHDFVSQIAKSLRAHLKEDQSGTGSTLIAAHDTGRVCYTAELSPAYVDTTVRRWQQHTGGTPQRNGVPHSLEP